jgi:hypothetical protein
LTQRTEFGFLPEPLRINEPRFRIEVLDDYPKTVEATKKHIHKDWIYPPPSDESPLRPAEYFTLPSTHSLAVPDTVATRFADFLILALGFVRGLHLLPGGWLHFHRACAKPEMILDFGVMNTIGK